MVYFAEPSNKSGQHVWLTSLEIAVVYEFIGTPLRTNPPRYPPQISMFCGSGCPTRHATALCASWKAQLYPNRCDFQEALGVVAKRQLQLCLFDGVPKTAPPQHNMTQNMIECSRNVSRQGVCPGWMALGATGVTRLQAEHDGTQQRGCIHASLLQLQYPFNTQPWARLRGWESLGLRA